MVVVEVVDVVVDVEVVVLTAEVVDVSSDAEVAVLHAETTRNPARIISRLGIGKGYLRPSTRLGRSATRGRNRISCTVQG